MTVAIVHYHLRRGGVTEVITAASRALAAAGVPHVIIVGEAPAEPLNDLPVHVLPALEYSCSPHHPTADELTALLRTHAREALGEPPGIWHFHNHSLGKNPVLAEAVARLAAENERIVLQIHDLAEAGRPASYQVIADCPNLYPVSSRIHYAFLNSRDLGIFVAAGLPQAHASVLPNPVPLPPGQARNEFRTPILFAPVRGIRRKNLGELVFLSAIAPEGTRFAVSRAPNNPEAVPVHDTWRKFAHRQRLPIAFDVVDRFAPAAGATCAFESWLAHATHFVTTSVEEGFGLPFLEATAHAKPLIGRNLPHLATEHARHGIHAGNLYDQILIPTEWIDLAILRAHLKTTLERNFRCFRRPLSNAVIAAVFDTLLQAGWLDFGNLPEPLQQGAIERLADPASREIPVVRVGQSQQAAHAWLAAAIANRSPTATRDQLTSYSPAAYRKNLTALYSKLAAQPASAVGFLAPAEILTPHLAPQAFHFLRSALPPAPERPVPHRAVIFDIYGTLLIAPAGGVKPDPAADPMLRHILKRFGHHPPKSPSTELHAAVLRHHAAAATAFPEIDLRILWREVLSLEPGTDMLPLVIAIEDAWHPARPMPGAGTMIRQLSRSGISLGLLSNAQANTLTSLGSVSDLFAPELTVLSYQHGIAKPSPHLFQVLVDRLAGRGITPGDALFIGNDPHHDIVPAAACGFQTALFTGHPASLRPGVCRPDYEIRTWRSADFVLFHQ